MLMKGDAEKEILYSVSIHKSQRSKLCVAFTFDEESFLSEQRHENETEFSRKVHYSGLYSASLTQRVFLFFFLFLGNAVLEMQC